MAKRSRSHDEDETTKNEFEIARLKRIERNKQVMAEMGCLDIAAELAASRPKKAKTKGTDTAIKSRKKEEQEPKRKSRRLACQPAEAQQLQHVELGPTGRNKQVSSSSSKQRQPSSSQALQKLEPSTHHNHNVQRICSMSEKALITRAWRITNVAKLKSFVEVLQAAGMETVLAEAQAALEALTGPAWC